MRSFEKVVSIIIDKLSSWPLVQYNFNLLKKITILYHLLDLNLSWKAKQSFKIVVDKSSTFLPQVSPLIGSKTILFYHNKHLLVLMGFSVEKFNFWIRDGVLNRSMRLRMQLLDWLVTGLIFINKFENHQNRKSINI